MNSDFPPSSKRDTLAQMLEEGMTMLHLDSSHPGVKVPQSVSREAILRINLSHKFQGADLLLNDEEVQATLSFGDLRFRCHFPWDSIFAMSSVDDDGGFIWVDAIPQEIIEALREAEVEEEEEGAGHGGGKAPFLRVLPGGGGAKRENNHGCRANDAGLGGDDSSRSTPPSASNGLPPYLRIIK